MSDSAVESDPGAVLLAFVAIGGTALLMGIALGLALGMIVL